MQNFINSVSSFLALMRGLLTLFSAFIPTWIVLLISAFIAVLVLFIALKVIASILEAIPFL